MLWLILVCVSIAIVAICLDVIITSPIKRQPIQPLPFVITDHSGGLPSSDVLNQLEWLTTNNCEWNINLKLGICNQPYLHTCISYYNYHIHIEQFTYQTVIHKNHVKDFINEFNNYYIEKGLKISKKQVTIYPYVHIKGLRKIKIYETVDSKDALKIEHEPINDFVIGYEFRDGKYVIKMKNSEAKVNTTNEYIAKQIVDWFVKYQ